MQSAGQNEKTSPEAKDGADLETRDTPAEANIPREITESSSTHPQPADQRKPIKKRRVDIDVAVEKMNEIELAPILVQPKLQRQVASHWTHLHADPNSTEPFEDPSLSLVKYTYEDIYGEDDSTSVFGGWAALTGPLQVYAPFNGYTTPGYLLQTPHELCFNQSGAAMRATISSLDDEEEDIEEELENLPRHCVDEDGRPPNAVTPSPSLINASVSNPALGSLHPGEICNHDNNAICGLDDFFGISEFIPSDFDPIPFHNMQTGAPQPTHSQHACNGGAAMITYFTELLRAESAPATHVSSPAAAKTKKRVRFDPSANTMLDITPRRTKSSVSIRRPSSFSAAGDKTLIEEVMTDNAFFSPIRSLQLGQGSSAFLAREASSSINRDKAPRPPNAKKSS